jgi:glycosyltransferase involved in cell wall biosynthesis
MNILIVSQYFWPEEFRINDLAIDLIERGHTVSVITGNPNYPKGKYFKGYGLKYSKEIYNGIRIFRVPIFARGNTSFNLIVNYLSFIFFGSVFTFFHKEKYDKVFAVNYSPITAVIPAIVYCKKHKLKLAIWVQDLWPESVIAASNIKSKKIQKWLTILVKFIYKNSDTIFVSNKGFEKSLLEKEVTKNKIFYMPNWAEDIFLKNKKLTYNRKKYDIPEGFVIMFAGNLGEGQDFQSIMKAVELTKENEEIKWVFVGDGRKYNWLKQEVIEKKLETTVTLTGRLPTNRMPELFRQANIMLVSLNNAPIFSLTVPGKVQSYMASSKPILTMLNGEANNLVTQANCGFIAESGDYLQLSENIKKCANLLPKELEEIGENGLRYYQDNFSKKIIIDNFIKRL